MNRYAFALAVILTFGVGQAMAGDTYVVHGVNGLDVGAAEDYIVDIEIDGACDLPDVMFRDIVQTPAPLATGSHDIAVYESDGTCTSGTLLISGHINVADGETSTLVAHLDQNGVPTLNKFTNNLSPIEVGDARVAIVHAAFARPLDVKVKGKRGFKTFANNITNGQQSFARDVYAKNTRYRITPSTNRRSLLSFSENLMDGHAYTVIMVGSRPFGTLEVLTQDIDTGP
jgi:hypothetical protein